MTNNKITTSNMTFYPQPNGNLLIRCRHFRNLVGVVLSLPFITIGVFILFRFIVSLFSGRLALEELGATLSWLLLALGFSLGGGFLLRYSLRQLRSPDILIEKTLQRVTLRPRLPLGTPTRSRSLDEFTHVVHRVSAGYDVDLKGFWHRYDAHSVGLMLTDGSVMPIAEISKRQRDRAMEMLTTATGLPARQLIED